MSKKKIFQYNFSRDFTPWLFYLKVMGIFFSLPILVIGISLFGEVGEMWSHIATYLLPQYLKNTTLLILGTSLLTVFLGVSSAWVVSRYEFRGRRTAEWLLFLPLAIPSYICAYAYVGIFGYGGSLGILGKSIGILIPPLDMMNLYGLIWVLSFSLFPYVYAASRASFLSNVASLRECATLLGANESRYFFTVALPLSQPAIVGGLFLVIMELLNDYGAAKYYGINTFTTGIFRTWTALEDFQSAIYLSALLVLLILLLKGLEKLQRGRKSFETQGRRAEGHVHMRISPKGWKNALCVLLAWTPIGFGFILPFFQLVRWAWLNVDIHAYWDVGSIAFQSFGLAFTTASLTLLFGLLLVYFSQWNPLKSFNFITKLATTGYIIPGAIIGIGLIGVSQYVVDFFDDTFQLKIGFLIYGSSFVLIYAYIVRFLALAYTPIGANSLKIGRQLAEASYLLGKKPLKTLRSIEIPLLKQTLYGVFFLTFIDTMKELPLTLLLKPYDVMTLAVKAFEYADDERVAEASIPALMLIGIVGTLLLLVNTKVLAEDKPSK